MKCKKILSLVLAAVLLVGLMPVRVFAVEQTCGDDAYWSLEDGTLTIWGTGAIYDYYGYEVYAPWEDMKDEITCVMIGEGITVIGDAAFSEMDAMEAVILPASLEVIGSFAFMGCTALETVELPFGLRSLGQECFWRSGLRSVEIPATVTFVDACVFESCDNLTDVLFRSNTYIPGFVMGNSVFRFCSSLEEIRVEEGHLALRSLDGALFFDLGNGELSLNSYPGGRKDPQWRLPEDTAYIGQLAVNNPWLETVIFPASVKAIGPYTFQACDSLKQLVFEGSAPSVGVGAFMSSQGDVRVSYPCGDESWENAMDSWGDLFGMSGSAVWTESHHYGEWVVVKEPTEYEQGRMQRSCTDCPEVESKTIPALGVFYGDANGDGSVNARDVILLRQHLAGWEVSIVPTADANGDGMTNARDLILLRQYLAGWDVTLG